MVDPDVGSTLMYNQLRKFINVIVSIYSHLPLLG